MVRGDKRFEVRKKDKDFRVGDILALNECKLGVYTGCCIFVIIDYILDNSCYCKDGYVIMSISPLNIKRSKNCRIAAR
ncbi:MULTISPECIES: DUF3850 domain-containing protein [unclassified Ruminococcus]|uniref:DUF3850 domain-containing protein n=1 Tax=unclassified Ruminococcus TaxID=2608920 RepID=UPI001A9A664A|nr:MULTISPECIES: DUF3850 domain-containing protein [unclassified Ruminococcus]